MYWRPSAEVRIVIKDSNDKVWAHVKTNLSKNGKVYPQKPSWSWIEHGYYNHILVRQMIIDQNIDHHNTYQFRTRNFPFIRGDWELEEIQ